MASGELQELKVLLQVRDKEFARAMDRNTKRINRFSTQSNRSLSRTTQSFNKLGLAMRGLIPALGAAMLIGKVRRVTAELDEIGKTADNIGLSTDALQELRVVAESSGVEFGEFTKAFQKFSVGIGEASDGSGTARDAFEKLGISIFDAAGKVKTSEHIFNEVSDALEGFTNDSERAGIAADLFGQRVGVKMLNLLRNGSQGMASMREEARKLGVVIDEDLIRRAEAAQTELDLLSRVMNAQVSTALIELTPLILEAGRLLGWLAQKAGEAYTGFSWLYDLATQDPGITGQWLEAADALEKMESGLADMQDRAASSVVPGMGAEQIEKATAAVSAQRVEVERLLTAYLAQGQAIPEAASQPTAPEAGGGESSNAALEAALITQIEYMKSLSMTSDELERQSIIDRGAAETKRLLTIARANDGIVSESEREAILMVMNALEAEKMAMLENADAQRTGGGARDEVTASAEEQAAALERVADAVRSEIAARAAGNQELARSFGAVIEQANSFREALDGVLKMAVKLAATAFLQGMFGVAPSGQSGVAAAISGMGAGLMGRASGGTVSAGTPYMVGENGPEPFIPAQSGRILSTQQAKSAMGGGGGTSITMNLNVTTGVQSTVRAEMAALLPQIENVAKRAVIDANQRGGAFRHALTGG